MSFLRNIFRKKATAIDQNAIAKTYPAYADGSIEQKRAQAQKDSSAEEFLDYWIKKAVDMRASDVHFEKYRNYVKVRYRIDGKLQTIKQLPVNLHSSIVTRVKILSRLKIDEKRIPQDGRFSLEHNKKKFDVRVSILPGYLGECIVMRLLQGDGEQFSLQKLGAREYDIQRLDKLIAVQNGIIIVAGPTGSGKSTTLYSIIKKISSSERKVLTVEDPVEYQLAGINQVSVNETIGMTFASALRSMLRQAPNVILIGEIRDKETAEIAIRAALTGHLVLSTVHAKDTVNAITRMLDLGVPSYLIAATLRGVLSQRLVRKTCEDCHEIGDFDAEFLLDLVPEYKITGNEKTVIAKGCPKCFDSGYRGRKAVMEILAVTKELQALIDQKANEDEIRELATKQGTQTIREIAIEHFTNGEIAEEALLSLLAEMN